MVLPPSTCHRSITYSPRIRGDGPVFWGGAAWYATGFSPYSRGWSGFPLAGLDITVIQPRGLLAVASSVLPASALSHDVDNFNGLKYDRCDHKLFGECQGLHLPSTIEFS